MLSHTLEIYLIEKENCILIQAAITLEHLSLRHIEDYIYSSGRGVVYPECTLNMCMQPCALKSYARKGATKGLPLKPATADKTTALACCS
jgi:hypothetical protein